MLAAQFDQFVTTFEVLELVPVCYGLLELTQRAVVKFARELFPWRVRTFMVKQVIVIEFEFEFVDVAEKTHEGVAHFLGALRKRLVSGEHFTLEPYGWKAQLGK